MKFVILVVGLVAVAVAAPPEPRSEFEKPPEVYSYETENGISRVENGEVKEILDEENNPQSVVTTRGPYSYIDPDGVVQIITNTADKTGFHPEGASIPKPVSRR